jgi:hypothetical protein
MSPGGTIAGASASVVTDQARADRAPVLAGATVAAPRSMVERRGVRDIVRDGVT